LGPSGESSARTGMAMFQPQLHLVCSGPASEITMRHGSIIASRPKTVKMTRAAKMPKTLMAVIGDTRFVMNATAVVRVVTNIVLKARRNVHSRRAANSQSFGRLSQD